MLIDEYKKIIEASGLKNPKITVKQSSRCLTPDTKDPLGKAVLDVLDRRESLEGIASVYIEGYK